MKKIHTLFLTLFLLMLAISCEEYLEEDYYSGETVSSMAQSESGMESLITACYIPLKVWYGKEYGWDLTTVGTDCWTYAGDADDMKNLAKYTSNFNNSWPGRLAVVWTELYKAINACNTALEYLPESPLSDELKKTREGEIRFLRALHYWQLVETWGKVAFYLEPITEPEYEMHRSDLDVFYTQIFEDLDSAVTQLPETLDDADYGRVHKYAALALRARANLYWATEYMSGNCYDGETYSAINGTDHYQQAIDDAQAVIDNSEYALYDTYSDIWDIDNNASADENTENIFAVNYSYTEFAIINLSEDDYSYLDDDAVDPKPLSEREGGCHGHMMFGMRWWAVGGANTVMVKDDGDDNTETEPTRPFCRYMPTKFLIDLYNDSIDQRFDGTFNYIFYANNDDDDDYPVWNPLELHEDGSLDFPSEDLIGEQILSIGDTAFVMYKNEVLGAYDYYKRDIWNLHKTRGYYVLDMTQMYDDDGTVNETNTYSRRAYFDMQKWYDRTRVHNGENQDVVGSQRGKRDFILFRLPEMYYIIAEASLARGNTQDAYNYLEVIADKRAVDGDGAAMMAAYGVSSASDVDIDFILDDKAREFAGEQHRWFDLKRTGKTLERIKANNPDAANIAEKHLVRPIPQVELDAIENSDDYEEGWGIY